MTNDRVDEATLDDYERKTARALEAASKLAPARSHLRRVAEDFRDLAKAYLSDARHFRETGDAVRSYGALNYAHAWLDAGARLGLFDVGDDDELFTLAN